MTITLADTLTSLLPSETETLFLRACLCSGSKGNDAWHAWQGRVGDLKSEFASKRPILSHFLPLLHAALQRYEVAQVETDLAFLLRAATFREELRAQTLRRILGSVLVVLHEANVYPVVLEGAALAATVYGSWVLRHCHDLDLLVDESAIRKAGQALREAGLADKIEFSPQSQNVRIRHSSQLPVELHAHLFEPPVYRGGATAMISRCQTITLDGIASRILSPSDALLHVCGHASYSPSRLSLRWVADAWFLISGPDFDWEQLIHAAAESKLCLPLYVMLNYFRSELEMNVPKTVLESLAHCSQRAGLAARETALLGVTGTYRQARAASRTWRSRLFLLRWRVLPTPSFLRHVHHIDSRGRLFRLYIRRVIRYVTRRCAMVYHSSLASIPRLHVQADHPPGDWARAGRPNRRPWEPTEQQALLVRSAVLHDQQAITAWREWTTSGKNRTIGDGSSVLLPILYRNLSDLGVREDPRLEAARFSYQMTWLDNQKLFRDLSAVLRSLQTEGIDVMILKGTALALLYYRDVGLRSLGDVDILVRPRNVRQAIALLKRSGWRQMGSAPRNLTETYLGARRAINFTSPEIGKLDLHWHVMMECCRPGGDDEFWSGAVPAVISGVETLAMNPTDQLLHVCAHEARWTPVSLPRWIADVAAILETPDVRIDWDRLVSHTRRLGLAIPVREALETVLRTVGTPIPDSVLEKLHAVQSSRRSRQDYEVRCSPPNHNLLRRIALEYRRMCLLSGKTQACLRFWAFPKYVCSLWGLDSMWQLPLHVLRWAASFASRARHHIATSFIPRR